MQINLKGHLALVTGGSGQLGRVMCAALAECGADLVVHYHQDAGSAQKSRGRGKGVRRAGHAGAGRHHPAIRRVADA